MKCAHKGEIIPSNEHYVTYVLQTNDVSYDNKCTAYFFLPKETINAACHIEHNITPH